MGVTFILDGAIFAIKGLELTLGVGLPDVGKLFQQGATQFTSIGDKLGLAVPGSNWLGEASEKYSKQNQLQQLRAKAVADIDEATGRAISAQAAAVQAARDTLREEREWLDGHARRIAIALIIQDPIFGWIESFAFQAVAAGNALKACGKAMLELLKKTIQNGITLVKNMMNLQNILGLLQKIPGWFDGTLPGLPNDINDLIPGLPELPNFPGLPSLPKWGEGGAIPGLPNIPGLNGLKGLPGLPIPGSPGLPSIASFFAGLPALGALPSMGNVTATVGQLTSLSGGLQQFSQIGQQVSQPIQQMVQSAQQNKPGEAEPAKGVPDDVLLTGDKKGAGQWKKVHV